MMNGISEGDESAGHELNDPQASVQDVQRSSLAELKLRTIQKFDGHTDAQQWLKYILAEFDALQLTSVERYELLSNVLTDDALVWYAMQQNKISNFITFIQKFLQHYNPKEVECNESLPTMLTSMQLEDQEHGDNKTTMMNSICNQMLLNNADKLTKFSGKSKQNVSKWVREFEQLMHICKLSNDEKLTVVSSWLEGDARDWFFDNLGSFTTWQKFIEKLKKTFESSGKSDIAFNRLRHYEQGMIQDVRQYYFEIMKLCKEANPHMDEASKLQYLKDGLKPSLRFDVLLKDLKTPEEFLEYAQRVEELKSLDERQNVIDHPMDDNNYVQSQVVLKRNNFNNRSNYSSKPNLSSNQQSNPVNNDPIQPRVTNDNNQRQYSNAVPTPPYQCYKCGSTEHFIRNCPHFQ